MQSAIPILIVGAGPSGLTMAAELQRHGIPFRIIDKNIKPVPTSNALVAQARTLEVWDDMGLLQNALEQGNKELGFNFYSGDKKIVHLDFSLLNTDLKFLLGISQHLTEEMLINHLQSKNIPIEMEVDLINIEEENNKTIATLKNKKGETETVQADWLIACDGGRSFIREKLQIPIADQELSQHFVLADIEIKSKISNQEGYIFASKNGFFLILPYNKIYSRMIAEVSNDPILRTAKALTNEQVARLFIERCPLKLEIGEPIWTSGFWIHERIVSEYRHNNVFFVGDAAHTHSPAGGQGMNTGIQDAYNLAWKLAFVIQSKANDSILDTYHAERYAVGKAVLRNTTLMTNMMTLKSFVLRGLWRAVISVVMKSRTIRKKMANTLGQLNIHYRDSI